MVPDKFVCVEFACRIEHASQLEAALDALDANLAKPMFSDTYGGFSIYTVAMHPEYALYVRMSDSYLSERMRVFKGCAV